MHYYIQSMLKIARMDIIVQFEAGKTVIPSEEPQNNINIRVDTNTVQLIRWGSDRKQELRHQ